MARYVDGFVIPVPKKNLADYKRMAHMGARLWRDHGALEYFKCVGDDLKVHWGRGFPAQLKLKRGEPKPCHAPGIRARRGRLHLLARAVRESTPHVAISGGATSG